MSDAAHRIYVDALSYCGDMPEPTGYLTHKEAAAFVKSRGKSPAVLSELVGLNAWERLPEGFMIHDFPEYLPQTSRDRTRRWRDAKRASQGGHGDVTVTPRPSVTKMSQAVTAHARAVPVPDPVPVLDTPRGDVVSGEANGAATPSPQVYVLRLLDWFLAKRGWSSWSSADSQKHEAQMAIRIVELGLPLPDVIAKLEAWWAESDPDDRPSSLEYFWTRLQDEQHQRLKQEGRSHVRAEGLTKVAPTTKAPHK